MNKPRLIDANVLTDGRGIFSHLLETFVRKDGSWFWGVSIENLIEVLDNQPTAYDIDKVVEQLEQKAKLTHLNKMEERVGKKQTTGFALGIREAIEIVKGGADK
mgnify:CR=1 FL=1